MKRTIVVPVYNSSATIKPLVEKLISHLRTEGLQIVLVNDYSLDESGDICKNLSLEHRDIVTFVDLARNFGEHNAVMAGLNYSEGDYTVIMDDDFQNPPEEVSRIFNEAASGKHDIVYTHYKKKEHNWFRNFGSRFNNFVANLMLDKPKDLYLSSFKCLSRFAVNEIVKYTGPFPYVDGLALRCTRRIGKIEVAHEKRVQGRSSYTLKKLVRLWLNMFVNFSVTPLRTSFFIGLLFSCLGVVLSVWVVVDKIMNPSVPIGYPSLFIAIMVVSGVQLLILGLIGEYLGHLFLSYNQTPQFIVREVHRGDKK